MRIGRLVLALSAALMAASMGGCASTVDEGEPVRSANPVAGMHQELTQKLESEQYKVEWYSYEDALVKARKENKLVMVEFYATWCKWCRKFETETLADPAVMKALSEGFVAVKLDAESDKAVVHEMRKLRAYELADLYEVKSFPAIWFVGPDGKKAKLLNGYLGPTDFLMYLDYMRSGEYQKREF